MTLIETLKIIAALCAPAMVALLGLMWRSSRASLVQQITTNMKLEQIEESLVKGEKKFQDHDEKIGHLNEDMVRVKTKLQLA